MDDGGEHDNGRFKVDYYKGSHPPWNMNTHQVKQNNALEMNKKIMTILAERDAAIRERNMALSEKRDAWAARNEALRQRDEALVERDKALMERDNAVSAILYRDNSMDISLESGTQQRGSKRFFHPSYDLVEALDTTETQVLEAYPLTTIVAETGKSHQVKEKKSRGQKAKKISEDSSNKQVDSNRKKIIKADWDNHEIGLNLIHFDEATMPVPVCSCTMTPRPCYKWGNGGWQSSCCTFTLSSFPLPQMPNKRHARVGGRKMSGSVFTRLLTRLAADGYDLSQPLDLKEYWAKHGTNRYITIK